MLVLRKGTVIAGDQDERVGLGQERLGEQRAWLIGRRIGLHPRQADVKQAALFLQLSLLLVGRFVIVRRCWQKALNTTRDHDNRRAEALALVQAHNPNLRHVRRDFWRRYGLDEIG
jgi:hypothetical protein